MTFCIRTNGKIFSKCFLEISFLCCCCFWLVVAFKVNTLYCLKWKAVYKDCQDNNQLSLPSPYISAVLCTKRKGTRQNIWNGIVLISYANLCIHHHFCHVTVWSDQYNIMLPFLFTFYFITTAEWGILWDVTLILEVLLKKAIWNIVKINYRFFP